MNITSDATVLLWRRRNRSAKEDAMAEKILLGMSGGLDSTYSALALQRRGYDVVGAVLKMSESTDIEGARRAAEAVGVPLHIVDCTEKFKNIVIQDFLNEYCAARTPNPCVVCNRYVKVASLCDLAKELGIPYVATGHYVNVGRDEETGRYYIEKAEDRRKDQSYVLWRLTQEQLSMLAFPLRGMNKQDIRAEAKALALPSADAPESQEICFIPTNDYVSYIEEARGKFPKGDFVDMDGKRLGGHEGIIRYTVGQRKGLGIALGKPAFVVSIDPELNTVTLSDDESRIFTDHLVCDTLNFMKLVPGDYEGIRAEVKIRYAAKPEMAKIRVRGDRAEVYFDRPVRAVTPGQSVVFYEGGKILGGGVICS